MFLLEQFSESSSPSISSLETLEGSRLELKHADETRTTCSGCTGDIQTERDQQGGYTQAAKLVSFVTAVRMTTIDENEDLLGG